jgi:hypothetical protein
MSNNESALASSAGHDLAAALPVPPTVPEITPPATNKSTFEMMIGVKITRQTSSVSAKRSGNAFSKLMSLLGLGHFLK